LADAEFRRRFHEHLDDWLDDLEARMSERAEQRKEQNGNGEEQPSPQAWSNSLKRSWPYVKN
jgi:hypothetical protein